MKYLPAVLLLLAMQAAAAAEVRDVPRNRTLISTGWDSYGQVPSPANFNPYAGILLHQRTAGKDARAGGGNASL